MKVLIASTNKGKVKEIAEVIASFKELSHITFVPLDPNNISEPDEPHETVLKNAIHKAKYYAKQSNMITISDDSGLYIRGLKNFPGVRTHDFVKECGSNTQAFDRLEKMLCLQETKEAYFHTAIAIYFASDSRLFTSSAKLNGVISFPARGAYNMGFDPIFIPDGYDKTIAELDLGTKNIISSRAKALKKALQSSLSHFVNY